MERIDELTILLAKSDDQLLEQLGKSLAGLGFGPRSGDPRGDGESWLARNVEVVRRLVCSSSVVESVGAPGSTVLGDVAIVADALAALLGWPVGACVAAIVVRRGLDKFCER